MTGKKSNTIGYLAMGVLFVLGVILGGMAFYNQGPPLSQIQKDAMQAQCQISTSEASANCIEAYESKCTTERRMLRSEANRLRNIVSDYYREYSKLADTFEDVRNDIKEALKAEYNKFDLNCNNWQTYDININKSIVGKTKVCTRYELLPKGRMN